jgi:hypothetical protein
MFDKEYSFLGTHAEKVKKLTSQFDTNSSTKLFSRNVDVYLVAPIIGFLYGRTAETDNKNNETTKIFPEQLIKESLPLKYNYQLIMLLDAKHEASFDERLNKAFRNYGGPAATEDEKVFESYVRGGVDVLYEKLVEHANNSEDYFKKLYDFCEEFHERYNERISNDRILELCSLARS